MVWWVSSGLVDAAHGSVHSSVVESAGFREELESGGVGGAHDGEVPPVEGRDRGLAEPFSDSDDRRVGGVETEIGVDVEQFDDPSPVRDREGLDVELAVDELRSRTLSRQRCRAGGGSTSRPQPRPAQW